jgi:hypothetical protein
MRLKLLCLAPLLALCGCAISRDIATVQHEDGSGVTKYRYVAAGGIFRPGVIFVVSQTTGSNPPAILIQASGSPMAPSVLGAAGMVGAAAALGATLPDNDYNATTVIANEPHAPMMEPPRMPPRPPAHPPNRPPINRPPNNRPPNRGH